MQRIALIGGGSWATALAKILTDNGHHIHWWVRNGDLAETLAATGRNERYLPSVILPTAQLQLTTKVEEVVSAAPYVILAIPAAFLKHALKGLAEGDIDLTSKIWISAIKGLLPEEHTSVSEYLRDTYDVPFTNQVGIAGPCHAEEVAQQRLSYLTLAGDDLEVASNVAKLLATSYLKTRPSLDLMGVEYAAVLKNVYALLGGICHGLGYGDNFHAVLASAAAREMEAFLATHNPAVREINDSAYLGDLLVTMYSQHSRNRTFGAMIGKGYTVQSAQLEMNMVAEGYYAARSVWELYQTDDKLPLPLLDTTYRILYEHHAPALEIRSLSEILR